MRVGSLVYATDQGLGILAKAFRDHNVVSEVVVVRHGRHVTHDDWYPNAPQVTDLKDGRQLDAVRRFCERMDVMLFFETPFIWDLIRYCRDVGTKTAIMPMHECMPERIPCQPDLWLCPSKLDLQWAERIGSQAGSCRRTFLPVPVEVPWRQRVRAEVFVHNAGWGGLKGRNGTRELLEGWRMCQAKDRGAKLILRSQKNLLDSDPRAPAQIPPGVELRMGTFNLAMLWDEGDVFVFPEKFNGLSLPLQEARAAGMLVIATNRFPMDTWLPIAPLIPVRQWRKSRIGPPYSEFDEAVIDLKDIAAKVDEWYGRDISECSLSGKRWAAESSWEVLGPEYWLVLNGLMD